MVLKALKGYIMEGLAGLSEDERVFTLVLPPELGERRHLFDCVADIITTVYRQHS